MSSSRVDSIKQALNLVEIVREIVALKRSGQNWSGLCPFHTEKTPSFTVSETKQLFYCYGCHAGGDIFKFVQRYYNWDFNQALEELARKAGIVLEKFRQDPLWEEGLQILKTVSEFFQSELAHPDAGEFQDYLKRRRIPPKMQEAFHLGAHLGDPQAIVNLITEKGFSRDIATQLGLIGRSPRGDWSDRLRGRLIFPILDERGRIRGFGGRSLGDEQPKYLNSPKSSVFDKGRLFYGMHLAQSAVTKKSYAVLVEGYLDVIALHEYGVSNALGSMGTALTTEQVRLLKRQTSRVISLYDTDKAGAAATEKNLGNFLREGIEAKVVILPSGKDPDAFLHQDGKSTEDLKRQLKSAFENSVLTLDYLVKNSVLSESSPLLRAKKLRQLVSLLNEIPDAIERTVLKKELARKFDLQESLLLDESDAEAISKGRSERAAPSFKRSPDKRSKAGSERTIADLARYLIQGAEKAPFLEVATLTELVPYLSSQGSWAQLLNFWIAENLSFTQIARLERIQEIADSLEPEVLQQVNLWAFEEAPELTEEEQKKLWKDLQLRIKKNFYKQVSQNLQDQILDAEQKNDFDKLKSLLTEKQDLARVMKEFENSASASQ